MRIQHIFKLGAYTHPQQGEYNISFLLTYTCTESTDVNIATYLIFIH